MPEKGIFGRYLVEKKFFGTSSSLHLRLGLEQQEKPHFVSDLEDMKMVRGDIVCSFISKSEKQ